MWTRLTYMTALALALGAFLAKPTDASAQIQPGRTYQGGEVISEPSMGLSLTIPSGWRGALAQDGSMFLMEPVAGTGLMVVVADEFDEVTARAEMSNALDLGDGVILQPAGEIREISFGHLSRPVAVTGAPMEMLGTIDVRLTSGGLGVAFIVLSPAGEAESHLDAMRTFALSLGVEEPTAEPEASGGDAWEPYLRGRYLARFYTGSGYTESTELWLCSDSSFFFNDQAGGSGGGASGAYQGLGDGRWSATGTGATGTLILHWTSGERTEWSLEFDYQRNELYVNDNRWLRGNNERCS